MQKKNRQKIVLDDNFVLFRNSDSAQSELLMDSLELGLVAGRLVLRVHSTDSAGLTGRGVAVSRDRVDDGAWHKVVVKRNGERLYVRYADITDFDITFYF